MLDTLTGGDVLKRELVLDLTVYDATVQLIVNEMRNFQTWYTNKKLTDKK